MIFCVLLVPLILLESSQALSFRSSAATTKSCSIRRTLLFAPPTIAAAAAAAALCLPANAFDNAVADYQNYADKPKRRGAPPKDLGVLPRTTEGEDDTITEPGLRTCDGNPNCFSTTGDFRLEDRQQYGVDFLIAPWNPPADDPNPLKTLSVVVKEYEPGQGGVDGGGFAAIKETNTYLSYQFESLKKGYIDDVEFASSPRGILVRSASRVGYTDFGVNAIRLNYLASKLRSKGWNIDEITTKSHRDYWNASDEARDATFDPDRRRLVDK